MAPSILNIKDHTWRAPPTNDTYAKSYPEPSATGRIPFQTHDGEASETWYAAYGEITRTTCPLIILHGGPGCAHNYLKPLCLLANNPYSRPVILYDQIGCGKSTHFRNKRQDDKFWTPDLFIAELLNLVDYLKIDKYDVLGQSWGGMLGAELATIHPVGLRRLIIANSPADMGTWSQVADAMRGLLDEGTQKTLTKCEAEKSYDSEEYEKATLEFWKHFVCRVQPMPKEVVETLEQVKEDDTVYFTMNGPSEFHVVGNLKTWDIRPQLLKIEVPTLLINGKYDEAQDITMQPYFANIKGPVKWIRFAESSHSPQFEEQDDFLLAVDNFLRDDMDPTKNVDEGPSLGGQIKEAVFGRDNV